jgi:hypothetical protein
VGAGDRLTIDVHLDVGDVAQTVEVSADAPLLNNENASAGGAITTKQVEDLPLNERSPLMLAQFEIGVIPSPFNSSCNRTIRATTSAWEARARNRVRCS